MKKIWMLCAAAGMLSFAACNSKTEESTTTTTDSTMTTETTVSEGTVDNDAMYNERADRIATQMGTELKLDTATQRKVRNVYYNRSKSYGGAQSKYAADTTGWAAERKTYDQSTETELKGILTPDQWKQYETNRMNYDDTKFGSYDNSGSTTATETGTATGTATGTEGTETKMKSDDMKMKTEGGESKIKTDDMKMKTEGDESKMKTGSTTTKSDASEGESKTVTGDSKTKTEPGKYKSKDGDTKIKVKND